MQEHPGRKHLSQGILDRIDATSDDKIVTIGQIPEGHVAKIRTQNSLYEVAVVNEEEKKIAFRGGNDFPTAEMCILRGSRFQNSTMMKIGAICPGLRFEVNPLSGGLTSTSPIKSVVVEDNHKLWEELVAEARESEPTEEPMSEEEFNQKLTEFVNDKITDLNKRKRVLNFLDNFGAHGKIVLSALIVYAIEHDKFEEAMELLWDTLEEEWQWVPPVVRANVNAHIKQSMILEQLYRKLDIPLPNSS